MNSQKNEISQESMPDTQDASLSRLMHEWPGIEPGCGFEEGVWRRIRAGGIEVAGENGALHIFLRLAFSRQYLVNAAAALTGIALGIWSWSVFSGTKQDAHPRGTYLMDSTTVAGSYLAMVKGSAR